MSKICGRCGSENRDDAAFCTECGAPLSKVAEPSYEAVSAVMPEAESSLQASSPSGVVAEVPGTEPIQVMIPEAPEPAKKRKRYELPEEWKHLRPMTIGGFFWLSVAFSVPFVGFLLTVILGIAAKKVNLKRYSLAMMIRKIIGFLIFCAVMGAFYTVVMFIVRTMDPEELFSNLMEFVIGIMNQLTVLAR